MRKNGSRLISFTQYKTTDLLLFAAITVAANLLGHFGAVWFPRAAIFTFSFIVPLAITIMMRWGWWGVLYAALDGVLYCAINGGGWESFVIYGVGNAFIALMLFMTKFVGRGRIKSKWYLCALMGALGWLCVIIGRSAISAFFGNNFFTMFGSYAFAEILSLAMAVLLLIVLRRFDGMLEWQKDYLLRIDKERCEMQKRDIFGEELLDLDEQALAALDKPNDDSLY